MGSRGQGFEDSNEIPKNYRELKVDTSHTNSVLRYME
jgi:hypothetical protein